MKRIMHVGGGGRGGGISYVSVGCFVDCLGYEADPLCLYTSVDETLAALFYAVWCLGLLSICKLVGVLLVQSIYDLTLN